MSMLRGGVILVMVVGLPVLAVRGDVNQLLEGNIRLPWLQPADEAPMATSGVAIETLRVEESPLDQAEPEVKIPDVSKPAHSIPPSQWPDFADVDSDAGVGEGPTSSADEPASRGRPLRVAIYRPLDEAQPASIHRIPAAAAGHVEARDANRR